MSSSESNSPSQFEPLLHRPSLTTSSSSFSHLYHFLEAHTKAGRIYEAITILLILINVLAFCIGTLFVTEYNPEPPFACSLTCDAIFFGNDETNGLDGSSVIEIVTVFIFTIDYGLRFYIAGEEKDQQYVGVIGRLRFMFSFFPIIDLMSIAPFYVDWFLYSGSLPASQFLRMFRLLRMMKVEGRYIEAFTLIDDVIREQKGVMSTAGFVGFSTWVICSAFYYVAEHHSKLSIYCQGATKDVLENGCLPSLVDVSKCTFNEWGLVNCTLGGCPGTILNPNPCFNLFQSIPNAAFFTLLNLFGEFPLIDQHSVAGKFVGVFVAVVAVAIFAIPAGIFGNGFEDLLTRRREERVEKEKIEQNNMETVDIHTLERNNNRTNDGSSKVIDQEMNFNYTSSSTTLSASRDGNKNGKIYGHEKSFLGITYNFLNAYTTKGVYFEHFVMFLIFTTTVTFMIETTSIVEKNTVAIAIIEGFELFAVIIFTIEYIFRVVSTINMETKYVRLGYFYGTISHCCTFFAIVDLLSIVPYWIDLSANVMQGTSPFTSSSTSSTFIRCLRLLRVLKAEKYTSAFTVFDDVLVANSDVLIITGFSAMVMWILFSALMYFAERNNNDPEMREYYNSVPNSMWMTLLNLSGEAPLCHYSLPGKCIVGIMGIFATGFFGIPIGLLGAGKYSKRRRSNVAVIHVKIVFISSFLFYCVLCYHSFSTNPNSVTNCFKLFSHITTYNYIAPASLFDF